MAVEREWGKENEGLGDGYEGERRVGQQEMTTNHLNRTSELTAVDDCLGTTSPPFLLARHCCSHLPDPHPAPPALTNC